MVAVEIHVAICSLFVERLSFPSLPSHFHHHIPSGIKSTNYCSPFVHLFAILNPHIMQLTSYS